MVETIDALDWHNSLKGGVLKLKDRSRMEATTMTLGRFELRVSEDDGEVAYLRLPTHSGETTRMSKSVRLVDLIGKYAGPDVVLDFDERGTLVGIEVVG